MYKAFNGLATIALLAGIVGMIRPTLYKAVFRKRVGRKFIGIVFGGSFLCLAILTAVTEPASIRDAAQKPAQRQQTASKTSAQAQQPTPTPIPKPQTTTDKLWAAADSTLKKRDNLSISYDAQNKVASIEHTNASPSSAEDFVRQTYSILALYGPQAFGVDGVNSLNVQNKTTFTDQYGNKSVDTGVTIEMTKENFQKFSWKNLEYQEVDTRIKAASDIYIVRSSISSQLKDMSKLYLVLRYP